MVGEKFQTVYVFPLWLDDVFLTLPNKILMLLVCARTTLCCLLVSYHVNALNMSEKICYIPCNSLSFMANIHHVVK